MATKAKAVLSGAEVVGLEAQDGFADDKTGVVINSTLLTLRLSDDSILAIPVKVKEDNKGGYVPAVGDKGDFSVVFNAYFFNNILGLAIGLLSFKSVK